VSSTPPHPIVAPGSPSPTPAARPDGRRHTRLVIGAAIVLVVGAVAVLVVALSGGSTRGTTPTTVATGPGTSTAPSLHEYGNDPLQQVRVYPAAVAGSPTVVLVHGGGWHTEPNEFLPSEAAQLNQAGFAVFDVNYRSFTAQGAFPHEVDDIVAATRFAIDHATAYNGSPTDVSMIGGSSGGQLVAMAALSLDSSPGTIGTVVTLSAPTDFTTLLHDGQTGRFAANGLAAVVQGLGCDVSTCTPARLARWSPAQAVTSSNCPSRWLIVNGTRELIPVDQSDALAAALRAHGCSATVVIHDDADHAFAAWPTVDTKVIDFVRSAAG
jgi:acetyl esterase/lipase